MVNKTKAQIAFKAHIGQIKTLADGRATITLSLSAIGEIARFIEWKSGEMGVELVATPIHIQKESHAKEKDNNGRTPRRKRRYPYKS